MAFRRSRFAHSELVVGKKSSSSAGWGFPLGIQIQGSTSTRAAAVYADDAGSALPAGSYVGFESRTLLTKAVAASCSVHGAMGHLRNVVSQTAQDNIAGLWGYNESSGTVTIGGSIDSVFSGVNARVDAASGATIGSGKYVSAIGVTADLGGTHTGKAGIIHVTNPYAGTWDYFAIFSTNTGACTAIGGLTQGANTYVIPVRCPDGSSAYIPVYAYS